MNISRMPKISINPPNKRDSIDGDMRVEIYAPKILKGRPVIIIGSAVLKSVCLFLMCTNIAHIADGIKQKRLRLCEDCCPNPRNILAAGIRSIPPPTPIPLRMPERKLIIAVSIVLPSYQQFKRCCHHYNTKAYPYKSARKSG